MSNRLEVFKAVRQAVLKVSGIDQVYDTEAPEDSKSPYVVMGPSQELQGRCLDDSERLTVIDLHIWSDYKGRSEILSFVDAIDASMPVDFVFDDLHITRDAESGWQHGIVSYKTHYRRK